METSESNYENTRQEANINIERVFGEIDAAFKRIDQRRQGMDAEMDASHRNRIEELKQGVNRQKYKS